MSYASDANCEELPPAARAARATYLLLMRATETSEPVTSLEVAEACGLRSMAGVRYLMGNLEAAGLPVWQPGRGLWVLTLDGAPDPGRASAPDPAAKAEYLTRK